MITASLVKELRERTGVAMMECKNALKETEGDIEAAIKILRERSGAKADKKASRIRLYEDGCLRESSDWETHHTWLHEKAIEFKNVFSKYMSL